MTVVWIAVALIVICLLAGIAHSLARMAESYDRSEDRSRRQDVEHAAQVADARRIANEQTRLLQQATESQRQFAETNAALVQRYEAHMARCDEAHRRLIEERQETVN